MTTDLFFPTEPKGSPIHPRLRAWKKRLDEGQTASLEIYRGEAAIGLARVRMFVHFLLAGQLQDTAEADWEPTLNTSLIDWRVRAIDQANEIERFSLGLRDGFASIEREFGNGYFNAVLLEVVHESGLAHRPEFADVMKYTFRDHVDPATNPHQTCSDAISSGISARAAELHEKLGYTKDEATTIMTAALARYLDERFSVSSRKRFGLL